jgi:hypothetical protein
MSIATPVSNKYPKGLAIPIVMVIFVLIMLGAFFGMMDWGLNFEKEERAAPAVNYQEICLNGVL